MSKELILESWDRVKNRTGIDPSRPGGEYKQILVNDDSWKYMMETLTEDMTVRDKKNFALLAENTRMQILQEATVNTAAALNPYETMILPILTVFYPRLIAKEAVTIVPMKKPDIFRPFIRAHFHKYETPATNGMKTYNAPAVNQQVRDRQGISSGPRMDVTKSAFIAVPLHPQAEPKSIAEDLGITAGIEHIQKDFNIYMVEVTDGTTTYNVKCDVDPMTNARFSEQIDLTPTGDASLEGKRVVLQGTIDYDKIEVSLSQVGVSDSKTPTPGVWNITKAYYTVTASLEQNTLNSKVTFDIEKIRFIAKNRQISAEWTVLLEQDARALYDINIQSELISIIASQIATDIDIEIINDFIMAAQNPSLVPADHTATFNINPPSGYVHGPKQWLENIYQPLTNISAKIYNDTNIGSGNILLANPMDAAVLEATNVFTYTGEATTGGDVGYQRGTLQQGKWNVFVSNNVPEGFMPMIYKPNEEMKATYIYAPYVPIMLTPYPVGLTPSMTIMTRYANRFVRTEGVSMMRIDKTPRP